MATANTHQTIDQISFPTILPFNQQVEVRHLEEDWTGVTDPALRRKLQNRLHQRAWRRRQARQAKAPGLISVRKHGVAYQRPKYRDGRPNKSSSSNPVPAEALSICTIGASAVREVLTRFEEAIHQHSLLGSPRTDLLLTLVKFNVFRALLDNTRALGFTLEWLEGDAVSPFSQVGFDRLIDESPAMSTCPRYLKPTTLQNLIEHHPWIDLFPIPRMRDNILRADPSFDEDALCHDMVEICGSPGERSGLIVWGDPWDPRNWEVGEDFLKNWGWVIQDCWELFAATNYWRAQRGEEKLFPDNDECTAG
ncbi:uncharacterized protein Z519_01733 [Cladophialophora bantiana CBS 173.52]|uniref:BZIP domain-containing protein n=1 Tax=Cladophialophora bantiana (strain ATCC 10958 / CBS 173.52 / CDC B-1940 / NIH 8579) TaxID=1442370 RepID=A0A0D2IMZ0_CLAB1|nr:uncharacterized protein Z519_01733 [Cladophialophora bantiana CBS 173.52]KIW98149.1 hypothetical protein Z519_01733 [Cladophialophora bantiana CBS 173.52]